MFVGSLVVVTAAILTGELQAATYYVAIDGIDSTERDGSSWETAWASLAFASEQVPEGKNTIRIGPGTYVATETAYLQGGTTIAGSGRYGEKATIITAATDWPLVEEPRQENPANEYLIAFEKVQDIEIRDLSLTSDPAHRITGAIRCLRCEDVRLREIGVREFRWAGMHFEISNRINVTKCRIENASTDKSRFWNGLIRTRYVRDSEFSYNRILSDTGGGYGYKGGGHTGVRIHHNFIDVSGGFAIESAHENEYGVEIDHNFLIRCVSIPKSVQSPDPNNKGYGYTFWLHHNYMTDSYTIEGPRNHVRVDHNYIHIEKPNGRVYTHHGGTNNGPIWIHNNVIENVDRAVVWMNRGLAENIHFYNNTVFCADAGIRTGALFSAYTAERLNGWMVKNNVFVAAWSRSRILLPSGRGVPTKITATNNLCINMTGLPDGNYADVDPGLQRDGHKPWAFYQPAGADSFVVDRGADLGLPYQGKAPDLGAVEFGAALPEWDVPKP
jgi:hypothetical protein